MHSATFHPGEIIFREGDESREAYWILSGKVEISIDTPQGRSVLTTLEEGEIFGEMGMIDDLPRAATARALDTTEVDVVNERDFHYEVLRDEGRLMPYLDMLFERLRSTNAMLRAEMARRRTSDLVQKSADAIAAPESSAQPPASITLTSTERSATLFPNGLRVEIRKFPFRIGRHPDHEGISGFGRVDLDLPDHRPYSVSRGHCLIERQGESYILRDCGSRLGTIVNGEALGAEASEVAAALRPGENRILLGSEQSPHEYLVTVA
jgi:CRP-like cAMP-binding protein